MKRRWLAIAVVPLALLPLASCISLDSLGARPLDFECGENDLARYITTPKDPPQIAEIRRDAGGDFGAVATAQDASVLESSAEQELLRDPVYRSLAEAREIKILGGIEESGPPMRVLMLSGGGQWGAFGAGLLAELNAEHKLPQFDLVTGVSTGAIQSLFAARRDFDGMVDEYTKDEPLAHEGGFFTPFLKGYLNDTAPLRGRLETDLCDANGHCEVLEAIAGLKSQLLMGMVEAATGDFRVVNVGQLLRDAEVSGALARPEAARRTMSCVVGVTLASSAVPVQLRPVRMHEPGTTRYRTYTDGGVRLSVFDAHISSMAALFAARKHVPVELYVIRNGPTVVEPSLPEEGADLALIDRRPNAPVVALKSYATLVNQNEVMSIASLRLNYPTGTIRVATADGYNNGALSWRESDVCPKPKDKVFDNGFMRCLAKWGADKAKNLKPLWIELSTAAALQQTAVVGEMKASPN